MRKHIFIWLLIVTITAVDALLLEYTHAWKNFGIFTALVLWCASFWELILPFWGFWYFKKKYSLLNQSDAQTIGWILTIAGILVWTLMGIALLGIYNKYIMDQTITTGISLEGVAWNFLLPFIFMLPLGAITLRFANAWRKLWSYLFAIFDILLAITIIVYVNIVYAGKMSIDYSPFIAYIFMIQLLLFYFTTLSNILKSVTIIIIISIVMVGYYFAFEIFFNAIFYQGMGLPLIFMNLITIVSLRDIFRTSNKEQGAGL